MKDDKFHELAQFGGAVPPSELEDLVGADEPEEFRAREGLADFGRGVDGVGGRGAVDLATAQPEAGLAFQRGAQEGEPLGIGGAGTTLLEGRLAAGDEEDGVEPELFKGVMGENEVAVMDGIKRAAVEAES